MTRRAIFVLVVAALLVAGCSSGGKQSVPKTPSAPSTTASGRVTGVPGGGTAPSNVAADLGPCPKALPVSLASVNSSVRGLNKKPVPIRALSVRICRYSFAGRLVGSKVLDASSAGSFADDTNRLSFVRPGSPAFCPPSPPIFFVTAASTTQRVSIASYHCGPVVNGAIVVQPTMKWFNALLQYTTTIRPPDVLNGIPLRRLAELARAKAALWSERHPFNMRAAVGSDRAANALMGRDGATYNFGDPARAYVVALDGHFACDPPECSPSFGPVGPSGGLAESSTTTTAPSAVPVSTMLLTFDPKTLQEDGDFRLVGHDVDMYKLGRVYSLDPYS